MRSARLSPVSPSMHYGAAAGGVSAPGQWCLLMGGGCMLRGVPASGLGGGGACLWSRGCIPACNGAEPLPCEQHQRHV